MTAIPQAIRILDEGRAALDAQSHPATLQRLIVPAYRLLVLGQPASPAGIAEAAGLRSAGCKFGHFFASADTAVPWLATFPHGGVPALDEAFETARRFAPDTFGPAA